MEADPQQFRIDYINTAVDLSPEDLPHMFERFYRGEKSRSRAHGGAGIGLAYVVPIAVGMRWYPDHKGAITGLAVAGFGFGALGWVKLAGSWGNLIDDIGLDGTFLAYGVAFAAIEKSQRFGSRWKQWARRLGILDPSIVTVLADGAKWIWEEQLTSWRSWLDLAIIIDWIIQ